MSLLSFVTSVSGVTVRDLNFIINSMKEVENYPNLLENVLITPLFSAPVFLNIIRTLKEQNIIKRLVFDSGGFQVQKGNFDYFTLYKRLLSFYKENRWADLYVLPDSPPTSNDKPNIVNEKVRLTAEQGCKFFWSLPSELQNRSIAVIQGKEIAHINYCLENYIRNGIQNLGFGSFPTLGVDSSINILTSSAIQNLRFIKKSNLYNIHCFGVGNPPTAYILKKIGINSFDSIGWLKTAAFGNIYFPFCRAYNVSYRSIVKGNGAINYNDFLSLKELTRHDCPFCKDFYKLSESRWFRMLHNLICMNETIINIEDDILARKVILNWSPSYLQYIKLLNKERKFKHE